MKKAADNRISASAAISAVFLCLLGVALPLTVHDAYFDVTRTKAAVFWLLHLSERRSPAAFGAGLALGIMNLTHPMTLLFTLFEVGFAAYRKAYRAAALAALGALLVVGSWCGAKRFHYHRLLGIQENAAFNLYLGNNPHANGKCNIRPGRQWRSAHRQARIEAEARGISVDRVFYARVLGFWLRRPFSALGLWV